MKFIVRHKEQYGHDLKKDIIEFLRKNGADWTEDIEKADFALIAGGDGTIMRDHFRLTCPVLGINPGSSVGYYLRADKDDYQTKILKLINGKEGKDYFVHKLARLEASLNGKVIDALALNDVLVSPVYVRRMFETKVTMGAGESIERNSGVIVYTPTGSHAFAHSAGAKRVPVGSPLLGVTALAPYSGMLKKQELTFEKGMIRIECLSDSGEVCIDGSEKNVWDISKGDTIGVRKSQHPLDIISFQNKFS